jgi:hypothetical protein
MWEKKEEENRNKMRNIPSLLVLNTGSAKLFSTLLFANHISGPYWLESSLCSSNHGLSFVLPDVRAIQELPKSIAKS